MSNLSNFFKRIIKNLWLPLAIMVITLAILFSLFRELTPWAKQYKGTVEQHLSSLLGQPVSIRSMETGWYWFEPVLKLNQVTISDTHHQAVKLDKLLVGIDIFRSLWHWQIEPGILYVDNVHLTLRQVNQKWQVEGLNENRHSLSTEPAISMALINWLLAQKKIVIKNVSAHIYLSDGTLLPIEALNLTAVNRSDHYLLKGRAKLAQTVGTEFSIMGDMHIHGGELQNTSGEIYISTQHFLPAQWQEFYPLKNTHITGGEGNFEVWLSLHRGQLDALQTQFNFEHVAWTRFGKPKSHFAQSIKANLAWKKQKDGWRLSADQIKLRVDGRTWPENKLEVDYKESQQVYRMFIEDLLLKPLLALDLDMPETLKTAESLHLHGELHDTQVEIKENQVDYFLTKFTHLGWQGNELLPKVDQLSGVLYWQPLEGRLELDANETTVTPHERPSLAFSEINGALDWKMLNQGLRINMERLVLRRPDLIISARGVLDRMISGAQDKVRLTAEFSGSNAEHWLTYLPKAYIKPKLAAWLKSNIKKIDKMSGEFNLNGDLADFPYDAQPGDFSVTAYLSGGDLTINKGWPLTQNIEAYLRFNKRSMDMDVLEADLQGVRIDHMNLHLDDIGFDKETLLVHGKIEAPAERIKAVALSSPLRPHLSKLKMLDILGPTEMDLRCEIPLYPENDKALVRGNLALNNNSLIVHHALSNIEIENLSGLLLFDERGIMDSELRATFMGDPILMQVKSVYKPNPYTEVRLQGNTTFDLLKNKFQIPFLSFFQGHFKVNGLLKLTDDPKDWDHLQISTLLHGVTINLPPPLGKPSTTSVPLIIDADFNPEKAIHTWFKYGEILKSDLWFAKTSQGFALKRGAVHLGQGSIGLPKQNGVQISGSLPSVDAQQWQTLWSKMPQSTASINLIDEVRELDLHVGALRFKNHEYPNVGIKAKKLAEKDWSFYLTQPNIEGELRYQAKTHLLSGHFKFLYLPTSLLLEKNSDLGKISFKPDDIPNLNLTIDEFKMGEVDIGEVLLKSTSTIHQWQLEYCKIQSKAYQLILKGNWNHEKSKDMTTLQASLQIKNLAESLKKWNITPAVEANQGHIQFNGGWPGPIYHFSLAKLAGELQMTFKNGRITNLSPETEEKLGLGKLLSILSLQTIPRRLKLDFSDLSKDGYSFDIFKGKFYLKNGTMTTNNSYIDGPVAYASMRGDLDVLKQLYDLDLRVAPHITASLPIVATIAGGPIAGLATWVISKLVNRGMQQISGYTYKISGPWLDPVVQQVSIIKHSASHEESGRSVN